MLTSLHTQGLAESLRRSNRFYYIIIDREGNLVYVNPLFQQQFSHIIPDLVGKKAESIFSAESGDHFKQALQHCLQDPCNTQQADLHIRSVEGFNQVTRWELSVCFNQEGIGESIRAIGFLVDEPGSIIAGPHHRIGEMAERFHAYEHSAEALWCCELKEPVTVSASPDEIIAHCRKYAFMSVCNDNMARMYGYEKGEELVGAGINELMNLDEQVWIDYLKNFITGGFNSEKVETQEYDRHGNILYFLNSMEGVVENGMLKRVWGTQQDITEQRKATNQISYMASLVDSVSDVIISQDKDFNVISWNKAAEMAYGYSAKEMIGKKIKDVLHFEYHGITRTRFFEMLYENGEWHGEAYVVNRHGRPITLLSSIKKIRAATGETTGYVSVSKDITEKRKMEEDLQKSEEFYRSLFANSLDGTLITDERGVITFASDSVMPVLGYSTEELMDKSIFNFTHPEERSQAMTAFMNELSGNLKEKFVSLRLLKNTGEWLWCFVRGHNLVHNPYVKGVVIYLHDDTIRRETEAALIASEERFRYQATVLNNVTDIIITTDANGKVNSWNKVLEKLSGIAGEEAIGRFLGEILPTDHSPYTIEQVAAIVLKDGIWRGEVSFTRKDGEIIHLLHTVSLLLNDEGNYMGFLGVGKDITERKQAETKLRESEQFYRNMSYHSFDGIIMSDKKGKITYCGPSVQKISGYEPSQILGRNLFDFIHPEDIPAATESFINELKKESLVSYIFLRLKHVSGQWIWCTVRGHNLMDTPGFNAMVIYFTNDSRRKEAEDRLRESEKNFRSLIYNLGQGVIVQDKDGKVTICNQAALDMMGLTEDQLLGNNPLDTPWDVIYEDGSNFPVQDYPMYIVFNAKTPVRDVVMGVYRDSTDDRVWMLANVEPILDNNGEIISTICSITDITEQKRLTRALFEQEVQKQKLLMQATIDGQETERQQMGKELHDNINQHLTTTRLYLEVAKEKAAGEVLEMIDLSHKTLAGIIYEIRQLSQALVPPTLGDIGLIESIQELCDSMNRAHTFNTEFYHRYFNEEQMPGNLKLMLYRITQEQVNNIVRHAHAQNLKIRLESDAEYIFLTISDDGKGFDPAHYKKGMGFSNISTRAGLFNGKVEIDTAPGKGCRLSVIIPTESTEESMN